MKLFVDRLTLVPAKHDFSGSSAWWHQQSASQGEIARPAGPICFEVIATVAGEHLHLEGLAEAPFEVECSRCAARYRHALREEFRLVLEPAGERSPPDPEGADALGHSGIWLGDDLESGWYRGAEIDIEAYLAEVVALAMPIQPLCRDECAGLCLECGANRNEADCGCSESKPNSPFAVLATLRIGQSEGKP
jgi:uncharacterized protein